MSTTTLQLLLAKCEGIIQGIDAMPDKDKAQRPQGIFADNYNSMIDALKKAAPDAESSLPPHAQLFRAAGGDMYSETVYNDIRTYCTQVQEVLRVLLEQLKNPA